MALTVEGPSEDTIDLGFGWCVVASTVERESIVVFNAPSVAGLTFNSILNSNSMSSRRAVRGLKIARAQPPSKFLLFLTQLREKKTHMVHN